MSSDLLMTVRDAWSKNSCLLIPCPGGGVIIDPQSEKMIEINDAAYSILQEIIENRSDLLLRDSHVYFLEDLLATIGCL